MNSDRNTVANLKNGSGLPICYDPEMMSFAEQEEALKNIYQEIYPWHGTSEAKSYAYLDFMDAVRSWSEDEFYLQHSLAKLYLDNLDWANSLMSEGETEWLMSSKI